MKTMTVLYVLTVSRLSYMCHSDCLMYAIFEGRVVLALHELEGEAALGAEEEDEGHAKHQLLVEVLGGLFEVGERPQRRKLACHLLRVEGLGQRASERERAR